MLIVNHLWYFLRNSRKTDTKKVRGKSDVDSKNGVQRNKDQPKIIAIIG